MRIKTFISVFMKSAYATRLKSLSPEVHVLPIHLSNGKTSSPTVKCFAKKKKKKEKKITEKKVK